MNATTVPVEIVEFATRVRIALADLPADEVEELTEGLEADLAEAFSEDLARELPDPSAYAEELRAAAGLPAQPVDKRRLSTVLGELSALRGDAAQWLNTHPMLVKVVRFLASLQPAWWVVRGWAAHNLVLYVAGHQPQLLPRTVAAWLSLTVMVVASVVVGLWTKPLWVRIMVVLGNVLAVFIVVAVIADLPTQVDLDRAAENHVVYENAGMDTSGVVAASREVTNIFAYDADGTPLKNVQLFDQDGNPIATSLPGGNGCMNPMAVDDGYCGTPGAWVPSKLATGALAWNVYPMQMAASSSDTPETPQADAVPQDRPLPFARVPALVVAPDTDAKAGASTDKKSE